MALPSRINTDPKLRDVLDLVKKEIMLNLNCHALATIQSFNSVKQTVTATINYKKTYMRPDPITGIYGPTLIDYPILVDCPIVIMQGGGSALTFPIAQGDTALILFNDRDIDTWITSGQVTSLASSRMHSFADGIALIGVNPRTQPITPYDNTRVVLQNGEAQVGVGESKIKIAAAVGTLGSILNSLVTTLAGLKTIPTVPGSPATLDPGVIASLNQIASQLQELLE